MSGPDETAAGAPSGSESLGVEPGLSDLRKRLEELQRSVELLGTEEHWAPAGETGAPSPGSSPAPAWTPSRATPRPATEWEQLEPQAAAAAVATNGHTAEAGAISARSIPVAMDAGPFSGLIELRHFEDQLAALGAVRGVRVRRFSHGRAKIEVAVSAPSLLTRELQSLDHSLEVSYEEGEEIRLDIAPPPEPGQETPTEEPAKTECT